MASEKKSNYWGKNAQTAVKKAAKKTHRGIFAVGVIFLLIGLAVGYLGAAYLSREDCFVLNGEKAIMVAKGSEFTYQEEGAKIISLGRDLSTQVRIDTDLQSNETGDYPIDTSIEATYVITYTVEDIKYGNIKRIRTITVVGGE